MTFEQLGIHNDFCKALTENNIVTPTPIQEKAIPFLLKTGTDFIGQAQTGTGKTATFGLPILQNIKPLQHHIQALILCPTRELGLQISKQLFRFTKYSAKIFTETVYGGERIELQLQRLSRTTHIIVATPGRLVELIDQNLIDISNVKHVVLDEADEMLSMGFKDELERILEKTSGTRNTWLFSATMPQGINKLIKNYMASDAYFMQIDRKNVVNTSIEHQYVVCDEQQKLKITINFLKAMNKQRGIIFCRTKATAINVTEELKKKGQKVEGLHGDMTQKEREKVMRAFKQEKLQILVATDISARGIDVANLAYVLHYQLPDQMAYYTHRAGRTGRAGKSGVSIVLIDPPNVGRVRAIEKEYKIRFKQIRH